MLAYVYRDIGEYRASKELSNFFHYYQRDDLKKQGCGFCCGLLQSQEHQVVLGITVL